MTTGYIQLAYLLAVMLILAVFTFLRGMFNRLEYLFKPEIDLNVFSSPENLKSEEAEIHD